MKSEEKEEVKAKLCVYTVGYERIFISWMNWQLATPSSLTSNTVQL